MPVVWNKEFPTMFSILKGDYEDEYRLKKAGRIDQFRMLVINVLE